MNTIQMDFFRRVIYTGSIGSLLFISVSCNREPIETVQGIIFVSVVDNDAEKTPVPDVELTITPGNITGRTNTSGTAIFKVDPGEYYVDADVCCIGPGLIQYHEPVTVTAGDTAEVEITACLRCL